MVNAARLVCSEAHACPDMTKGSRAFVTVGLPLIVLTVSGFYGLSHLVQDKHDVQVSTATSAELSRRACMAFSAISICSGSNRLHASVIWQAQRQKVVDLKVDPEKQKSFSLEEELQVSCTC